jgi:hypothetical protein
MNYRLTIAAAVATILASSAEFALIHGGEWYVASSAAVVIVALAGTATRLSPVPSAIAATVLTAIASVPLFSAHSLYLRVAGAVLVACCAASASGLRPLRAIAGLATYLAALLIYLNILLAATKSVVFVIPTGTSMHYLGQLARAGMTVTGNTPPVNGSLHGIQLLAAGSIGLAAIVVDFLAVRLRKPAPSPSCSPRWATWHCCPRTGAAGYVAGAGSSRSGTRPARTTGSAGLTWGRWRRPDAGSAWLRCAWRSWRRSCCPPLIPAGSSTAA